MARAVTKDFENRPSAEALLEDPFLDVSCFFFPCSFFSLFIIYLLTLFSSPANFSHNINRKETLISDHKNLIKLARYTSTFNNKFPYRELNWSKWVFGKSWCQSSTSSTKDLHWTPTPRLEMQPCWTDRRTRKEIYEYWRLMILLNFHDLLTWSFSTIFLKGIGVKLFHRLLK